MMLLAWVFLGGAWPVGDTLASEAGAIELRLVPSSVEVELDKPVHLTARFENVGDDAVYLKRPVGLDRRSLSLIARRGACTFEASSLLLDRPIAALRFDYVPLLPGDSLITPLPAFNEPGSALLLEVPGPGVYSLVARFESDGPVVEGGIWPIWRGQIEAAPVRLELLPMEPAVVERWTRRLEACRLNSDDCDVLTLTEFFRKSRVEGVAPLLRELLEKEPGEHLIVASALVVQGEAGDAAFLASLAEDPDLDERSAEYLVDMAGKLSRRESDSCWWSRVDDDQAEVGGAAQ